MLKRDIDHIALGQRFDLMPKSEKKREAPMPMSGAGLMRFFEDETEGIKIKPTYVVITSVVLISIVIVGHLLALF